MGSCFASSTFTAGGLQFSPVAEGSSGGASALVGSCSSDGWSRRGRPSFLARRSSQQSDTSSVGGSPIVSPNAMPSSRLPGPAPVVTGDPPTTSSPFPSPHSPHPPFTSTSRPGVTVPDDVTPGQFVPGSVPTADANESRRMNSFDTQATGAADVLAVYVPPVPLWSSGAPLQAVNAPSVEGGLRCNNLRA